MIILPFHSKMPTVERTSLNKLKINDLIRSKSSLYFLNSLYKAIK